MRSIKIVASLTMIFFLSFLVTFTEEQQTGSTLGADQNVSVDRIKTEYDSVLSKIDINANNYDFTVEEINVIRNAVLNNERFNVPFIYDSQTPTFFNYIDETVDIIGKDDIRDNLFGVQFLISDILNKMFGMEFDYVSYADNNVLVSDLISNERHFTNENPLLYTSGLFRTEVFEKELNLYNENLFTKQMYAYVNINSPHLPNNFNLKSYLFEYSNPLIAYVGSDYHRKMIDYKLPNADFFYCSSVRSALVLEHSEILTPGCSKQGTVPYRPTQLAPESTYFGRPLVIISDAQDNKQVNTGDVKLDYYLINELFQFPSSTVASNKNKKSSTILNVIGKILYDNLEIIDEYRGFLYDVINTDNVVANYEASLLELTKRPTRVGLYVDSTDNIQTHYQPYVIEMLRRIYGRYSIHGEAITYEKVTYTNLTQMINDLNNGVIDMVGHVPVEMLSGYENITYSQSVLSSNYILVSKDKKNISNIANIYSKTVAYSALPEVADIESVTNDVEQFLSMHKAGKTVKVSDKTDALDMLKNNLVDYVLIDRDFFEKYRNIKSEYDMEVVYQFDTVSHKVFAFSMDQSSFMDASGESHLSIFIKSALAKMPLNQIIIENYPPFITVGELLLKNNQLIMFLKVLIIFAIILMCIILAVVTSYFLSKGKHLKQEVNYDFLTGCKSRKALYEDYESLKGGTFLFMDVNDFKQVNDAHGHEAGDEVLKFISSKMFKYFGRNHCYRIGGDEFIIMTPESNQLANLDLMIQEINSGIMYENNTLIQTNLAVGYTVDMFTHLEVKPSIKDTLVFLDKAMYRAKENSTDSIVFVKNEEAIEYFSSKRS